MGCKTKTPLFEVELRKKRANMISTRLWQTSLMLPNGIILSYKIQFPSLKINDAWKVKPFFPRNVIHFVVTFYDIFLHTHKHLNWPWTTLSWFSHLLEYSCNVCCYQKLYTRPCEPNGEKAHESYVNMSSNPWKINRSISSTVCDWHHIEALLGTKGSRKCSLNY